MFATGTLLAGLATSAVRAESAPEAATESTQAESTLADSTLADSTLEDSPKTVIDEVWQLVHQRYVDRDFDYSQWETTRTELLSADYDSREEAYAAIRTALEQLDDPYTRFLDPDEYEDLTNQTAGELTGIGIRMEINDETQKLTVVEPIPNSPAMESGLESGDQILAIDDQPTSLMSLDDASRLIRGEAGTTVELRLNRRGRTFDVAVTRAAIELPTVTHSLRDENGMRVGYIKLDEFSSHAAEQMRAAIEDLDEQNVQGYVLDLRGNPGGLLFASIEIARMFMRSGEIVYTVDRLGGDRHFSANNTALTDLPLVVLVDGRSASASEILAGALQENDRATLVGTRTYGKGTVQSVTGLSDGSGLAVTVSRYYPPSGTNINEEGIAPDVVTELGESDRRLLFSEPELRGTRRDPQYARAVTVLNARAADRPTEVVSPNLGQR